MFTELKELLRHRSLTITVAVLENEHMRVNVVPHARPDDTKTNKQISYSHKSEVAFVPEEAFKALTTPISITGAAEEIDQQLPAILAQYVESISTSRRASTEPAARSRRQSKRSTNVTKPKPKRRQPGGKRR
jgi:PRTRC genetic system protein E